MASPPAPPPPPISSVPPPPPGGKGVTSYALLKLQASAGLGNGLEVGETEAREVTLEEFTTQVSTLISERVGDLPRGLEESGVVLAVVVPVGPVILQNGPMCGLVALAEALHILNKTDTSPKALLDEAVLRGYSKQGEMFSVEWMAELATSFGCERWRILNTQDSDCVREMTCHILGGNPALFPYDADFNHSPSLRKGHAAHWAVVHGLCTAIPPSATHHFTSTSSFKVLAASPDSIIVQPITSSRVPSEVPDFFDHDNLHVIAHQGKSLRTAIWKLTELFRSNQNLIEIPPKILEQKTNFVCDDIVRGLCSKILLLQ